MLQADAPPVHPIDTPARAVPSIIGWPDKEYSGPNLADRLLSLGLTITPPSDEPPPSVETVTKARYFQEFRTSTPSSEDEKEITIEDYESLTVEDKLILIDDFIGQCLAYENSDERIKVTYGSYLNRYLSRFANLPFSQNDFDSEKLIEILAQERMRILGLNLEEGASIKRGDSDGLVQLVEAEGGVYQLSVTSPASNVTIQKVFFPFEASGVILIPLQRYPMGLAGPVDELSPQKGPGKLQPYISVTTITTINSPFVNQANLSFLTLDIGVNSPLEIENPIPRRETPGAQIRIGKIVVLLSDGTYMTWEVSGGDERL